MRAVPVFAVPVRGGCRRGPVSMVPAPRPLQRHPPRGLGTWCADGATSLGAANADRVASRIRWGSGAEVGGRCAHLGDFRGLGFDGEASILAALRALHAVPSRREAAQGLADRPVGGRPDGEAAVGTPQRLGDPLVAGVEEVEAPLCREIAVAGG